MTDIAIRVENLSKLYTIGRSQQRHDTLRDAIVHSLPRITRISRKPKDNSSHSSNSWQKDKDNSSHSGSSWLKEDTDLWALKDVSFEVKQGEVVGVIGRNGAGKSTLLKILSRITEPTSGRAEIHGRVGSLLEVGTGFHPELTGRENIYLNGAILGMRRVEIARRFDEIVAFAEIERFLDTPVKRYSSGMYVRLAFAVAAHLEPEILLVDEVLAVGDAQFQKKCLGKMGDVAKEGRTILFVSHNMGAIVQLCPESILLSEGNMSLRGKSEAVVKTYLAAGSTDQLEVVLDPRSNANSPIILERCWIADGVGNKTNALGIQEEFTAVLLVQVRRPVDDTEVNIILYNTLGYPILASKLSDSNQISQFQEGSHRFSITFPREFLAPDDYSITVGIHRPGITVFDLREHVLRFHIEESGSNMWYYSGASYGNILTRLPWQHACVTEVAQQ